MARTSQKAERTDTAAAWSVDETFAPGAPGERARWARAAKDGVGTAIASPPSSTSTVWFTLSLGMLTEVYYPRLDCACISDLELIVADGGDFFSAESSDAEHVVEMPEEGAPLYRLTNACRRGRYRTEKEVLAHPSRNAILQRVRFTPLKGGLDDYRVYAVLHPHVADVGSANQDKDVELEGRAWLGQFKGARMLFARREGRALALACSSPWIDGAAGFVGTSDGRRDLAENRRLTYRYERAEAGNAVLVGDVDLRPDDGRFVLALGLGPDPEEAAHHARAALLDDFGEVRREYVRGWREWRSTLDPPAPVGRGRDLAGISGTVLRTHDGKAVPGAMVASLSTPWGEAREASPPVGTGGYHLVWPRDLAMAAGGYLALGARAEAARVARYLRVIQGAHGDWPQNARVSGAAYWNGVQIGETAQPILLVDLLRRQGALDADEAAGFWPMVRRAVGYLVRSGPSTQEDRWENETGFTPFTLALVISAFLTAADFADEHGEADVAAYLRETADSWNGSIEEWLYATDTELARRVGVDGYYALIMPSSEEGGQSRLKDLPDINIPTSRDQEIPPEETVSPDFLALVRYGLRAPDDPKILNTVRVVDAVLRVETPRGPCWRRYNGDGYGEHADGAPYDGKTRGIGRAWPLLTGERGHYELAAGNREEAIKLLDAMAAFANDAGLIPEQVWDADPIPERLLFPGRPAGSAMPLVWAHAEYLKLRRSLQDGRIFDQPPRTARRFLVEKVGRERVVWRLDYRRRGMPAGGTLRVELCDPGEVQWTVDDWATRRRESTRDTTLGIHLADLPAPDLAPGGSLRFTIEGPGGGDHEGEEFRVDAVAPDRRESVEARRES